MVRWFHVSVLAVLLLAGIAAFAGDAVTASKSNMGKLRHVVLFKFTDNTTPEQVKEIEDAFRALPKQIPQIAEFEWGTNNSPENIAQGYTHCFFVTFHNEADRAVYLPHPAHKAFGKLLHPHLDKVLVIDYIAKD
jgi:hypothetical protein